MIAPLPDRATLLGFMFHEVTDDPAGTGFQRAAARPYTCAPSRFNEYLDAVAAAGYTPSLLGSVALAESAARLLFTFDDGGRSALLAGDLLMRRGWRGHFFVVTSRIGAPGFLDRSDIRYLRSCGHLVGSHSHTHPDIFPELSVAEMLDEWRTSRVILEQLLGETCTIASLPGGDLSDDVRRSARTSGLSALFTSEPWLHPRRSGSCLLVGRYAVKGGLRPERFARLLGLRGWEGALVRRRASVIARRGLAPLYRMYVRHRTAADPSTER
jgi:peptidoglycan/xylan/chitin deacetylase (PgdA/CDA1 family)